MEIIDRVRIFNKDSRYLLELEDNSVDIIMTSPPFNIDHPYNYYSDSLSYEDFFDFYSTVINSVNRVLRNGGLFIIDIADVIVMSRDIVRGPLLIKYLANLQNDLNFIKLYPYEAIEMSGEEEVYDIKRDDFKSKFHSTCETILVFGKKTSQEIILNVQSNYIYNNLRDYAFWPQDLVNDILNSLVVNGKIILDPFMGSGLIGKMVIERGGSFIGYDVDYETLNKYGWSKYIK